MICFFTRKVIPIQAPDFKEAYDVRLEELEVIDLKFIHRCLWPTLAVLYQVLNLHLYPLLCCAWRFPARYMNSELICVHFYDCCEKANMNPIMPDCVYFGRIQKEDAI